MAGSYISTKPEYGRMGSLRKNRLTGGKLLLEASLTGGKSHWRNVMNRASRSLAAASLGVLSVLGPMAAGSTASAAYWHHHHYYYWHRHYVWHHPYYWHRYYVWHHPYYGYYPYYAWHRPYYYYGPGPILGPIGALGAATVATAAFITSPLYYPYW